MEEKRGGEMQSALLVNATSTPTSSLVESTYFSRNYLDCVTMHCSASTNICHAQQEGCF